MEGYYPIQEYCRLAGVSRDTAYHRTNRKEIPFFKDETGRMFIYYADYQKNVPDGFVSIKEYAETHNLKNATVRQNVVMGNFKPEDIYKAPDNGVMPYSRRIYINNEAKPHKKVDLYCPPGYINAKDWCKKYNITRNNLGQRIRHGKVHPIKIGRYLYLEDKENPT